MLSLFNIYSIAIYEIKNLLRSWFFRIFTILSLAIIVMINIGLFGTERTPSSFKALPSFIPYLNILLINIAQAVIGGFMASDFMKYDRKLNTTDVVYMRSMTNADYVLGKTFGVLTVFIGLNLAALLNAFIFNVFISDMPFLFKAYVMYPLLISLPTLLFVFGLAFLLMSILRNQALTFILLLGYIAITLFFLGTRYHQLFDYMAFYVPMTWSDFAGFGNERILLMQRGIYAILGIGFIFATVLMLKRLPQSRFITGLSAVITVSSVIGAITLGGMYTGHFSEGRALRQAIDDLNSREGDTPAVSVTSYTIDLNHDADEIAVKAGLVFTNGDSAPIERYLFSLNPGLEIARVSRAGHDVPFTRNIHHISVKPDTPLAPGAVDSLVVEYAGSIDEEACFPDIEEEVRNEQFRLLLYNIAKRYAFIGPEYVLLTTEALWYPVAGVPYGSNYPHLGKKDFANYTLTVRTSNDLTPVSQGAMKELGDGVFVFTPSTPLPRMSLAIGRYQKKTMVSGGVEYGIFILDGHDVFSGYFTDIVSTIPDLIENAKSTYEDKLGMSYPYERLYLIETPAQFFTYPRLWTVAQETVQPEQVLLPEKAFVLFNADFRQRFFWMQRMVDRGNRAMTPEEMQSEVLRSFITSTLTGQGFSFTSMRQGMGARAGSGINLSRLVMGGIPNHYGSYDLFPLYYSYTSHFASDRWPVFTAALELYLSKRTATTLPGGLRNIRGLSDDERANLALADKTLMEALSAPGTVSDKKNILTIKSTYLFSRFQTIAGGEPFIEYLDDMLLSNRFKTATVEAFADGLGETFGMDIEPIMDNFLEARKQPAFVLSEPAVSEIVEGSRTRYHVSLTVSNMEPVEGVIGITFRYRDQGFGGGGRGGGGFMMFGGGATEPPSYYAIPANTTREIGVILDDRPGAITIDTIVSLNIPSVIEKRFGRTQETQPLTAADVFEGERTVEGGLRVVQNGEVIVDNEDPSFRTISNVKETFVKKLFNNDEDTQDKYIGLQFWNMPRSWQATTDASYYGLYRLSAMYIRPGNGLNKVVWNAELPSSGRYNVYYHVADIRMPFMRGGRGGPGGGAPGGSRDQAVQDFHFTINHDDGAEEVEFDAGGADAGWVLLGTFYFSAGRSSIELSDQTKGRLVYADAVRWLPQE